VLPVSQNRELVERPVNIDIGTRSGHTVVELSCTGNYISILWSDFTHYQIFEVGTWKLVEEGNAIQLVWSSNSDRFAILQPRANLSKETIEVEPTRKNTGPKLKRRAKESVASLYQVNVRQIGKLLLFLI
jgi:hypothetical protein